MSTKAHKDALEDDTLRSLKLVDSTVSRLRSFLENPILQAEVQSQLVTQGLQLTHKEGIPKKTHLETSTRGIPMGDSGNPSDLQGKKANSNPQEYPLIDGDTHKSDSPHSLQGDVAPRRRREKRSPNPRRKISPSPSPPRHRGRRDKERERKKRRRSPSSTPPSSPSSSSSEEESSSSSSRSSKRRHHRHHLSKKRNHRLRREEYLFPHLRWNLWSHG